MVAKRKREAAPDGDRADSKAAAKKPKASTPAAPAKTPRPTAVTKLDTNSPVTIQIIAGSYDRVLHGVTVTVNPAIVPAKTPAQKKKPAPKEDAPKQTVTFADTFLFNAHNSAIRCLALSPPSAPAPGQSQKVLLATGSTDERINIYNLSAHPPSARAADDQQALSSLAPRPILENPKNRELGTLLHHAANITRLAFPNRSKLLSAAEDSTVAVTRSRDWTLLHSFKCPVPKAYGRPSGDTAALGTAPAGVNDFAVHPSNKIMISVSKGERCMRLWNLETGKKSRVLNFERVVLGEVGEGRHSTGEARRIVWGSSRDGEDEFAVAFERDVLVFGMDCLPRCRVMGEEVGVKTKVHEICYVRVGQNKDGERDDEEAVLVVSTEDGRLLFFSTAAEDLAEPPKDKTLPIAKLVGQLGGKEAGVAGRIKDFMVLPVEDEEEENGTRSFFIVTAGSDGRIRLWQVGAGELLGQTRPGKQHTQAGDLLGVYETQNRITCLEAFVMITRPAGAEESEYEFESDESEDRDEE
ncbi:WD40-repeat-containing domain protein [Dichotomopilus funicola]|uniref:WD40-repeat-containing domain protein n=1 Tax=Dichotomopilus funicola TaxID=1934379 RepID=A0AAN6V8P9_9PEZI|nr:WD40-repeat-containing domain protein [Dichotomopilus funicola]